MPTTLVLGGARSGKTWWAQKAADVQAALTGVSPLMIATAEALDAEMAERIARHRADRGEAWRTLEAPIALPEAIRALAAQDVAVVDCLTLWVSNLMQQEADIGAACGELVAACEVSPARIFLVSNEVGLGIVPDNPLARRFRDEVGWLHQALGATVSEAVFIAAGLPLWLKRQDA